MIRILAAFVVLCSLSVGAATQTLKEGDTIAVSVFQDSKLDRQVVIGPTGMMSFPLVGQIKAAGMTPQGLEQLLKRRLRDRYTADLDITVSVIAAAKEDDELKPRIYVMGEVNRPGPYILRPNTTVLQAIALAGGLGPYAAKQRIQIRRRVDGVESIIVVDYRAFEAGTDLTKNVNLNADDVIIVPERGLFE